MVGWVGQLLERENIQKQRMHSLGLHLGLNKIVIFCQQVIRGQKRSKRSNHRPLNVRGPVHAGSVDGQALGHENHKINKQTIFVIKLNSFFSKSLSSGRQSDIEWIF